MKLPRANEWMFKVVECAGYMQKLHDGRYIAQEDGEYWLCDNNRPGEKPGEIWQKKAEFDEELKKTYYRRKETAFAGVVIGMRMVTVSGVLYVDFADTPDGREIPYIQKEAKEQTKCAVVAYGMNKTRLVPLADITIKEDIENEKH